MKKILFLLSISLYCLSAFSQTLTTTATTVTSGSTVTLTGSGESNSVYFVAEQGNSVYSTVPTNYYNNQTMGFVNVTYYNKTTHTPTSLQFKLTSTASVPVTVKYEVIMLPYDNVNLKTLPPVNCFFTVTINPAPNVFYNVAESGPWYKNDCGSGYVGTSVPYTVPAATYSASTQAAANQLAINAGQAYVNAHATCQVGIFARLEITNQVSVIVGSGDIRANQTTGDVNIRFYSNAACTTPLTLASGLSVLVTNTSTRSNATNAPNGTTTTTYTYTVPSGVSTYLVGNEILSVTDASHGTGNPNGSLSNVYTLSSNGTYTIEL